MSRGDLDKIQARLKVAIQSHQQLVAKLKSEPQNAVFQKQLHDLQSQITTLSEKQRSVVQLVRKELVHPPGDIAREFHAISPVKLAKHTSHTKEFVGPGSNRNMSEAENQTMPHVILSSKNRSLPVLAPKPPAANNHQTTDSKSKQVVPQESFKNVSGRVLQHKNVTNNNRAQKSNSAILALDKGALTSLRIPRPSIFLGGPRHISCKSTGSSLVPVSARRGSETDLISLRKASIAKESSPEERKKLEFMASLDLITQNTLKEIQSRKSERKRRSTANPQFRVNTTSNFEPPPAESDIHEDYCSICHLSGEMLMCDTCNLVYHLHCLEPPLEAIPQGLWSCPKCHGLNKHSGNWPGTLALVQSYITHKAAKEEEKGKLKRKKQDLQGEKVLLDKKAKTLSQSIAQQVQEKSELIHTHHGTQQSVDQLKNLVKIFQTS